MVFIFGKRKAVKTCKTLADCCLKPYLFIVAPDMGIKLQVLLNEEKTEFVKYVNAMDYHRLPLKYGKSHNQAILLIIS